MLGTSREKRKEVVSILPVPASFTEAGGTIHETVQRKLQDVEEPHIQGVAYRQKVCQAFQLD